MPDPMRLLEGLGTETIELLQQLLSAPPAYGRIGLVLHYHGGRLVKVSTLTNVHRLVQANNPRSSATKELGKTRNNSF